MKKYWKLVPVIAGLVCLLLFVPRSAHAAGDVVINSTNFPDDTFRQYVKDNFDTDKDNKLSSSEIEAATRIDVTGQQLTSLKGLNYLTNLQKLYCDRSKLTKLDISKNAALTYLSCTGNQLTSLDVSKNTALTNLFCSFNQLTALDVSRNASLDWLGCGYNQLTVLDVRKNTSLTHLSCEHNQLTALDISKNAVLENLRCDQNQFTALNVSKNTALTHLICDENPLHTLDVRKNTALYVLSCVGNQLTTLDVSMNTRLSTLDCYDNQLKKLDISQCPVLVDLYTTNEKVERSGVIRITEGIHDLRYDNTTKIIITDENPFTDVKRSDSYYDAVMWAVENGITSGTSATTFSPDASCTRYQFAVMLYKLNGKPSVGNVTLPFKDVKKTDSYYNAVAWAYTKGIISGTSKTTFSPKDKVTRYQVVQMLYKSIGKPAISTATNPFKDVKKTDSYYNAVLWAVEKGITKGTSSTTFSPKATCKRYQMVVFLKKFNDQYHIK